MPWGGGVRVALVVDPQLPALSVGPARAMSSRAEKKRKVSAQGSASRGGTRRRAAQAAALASQAAETTLASGEPELEPEPEPLKEELGGYLPGKSLEAECWYLKRVRGLLLLGRKPGGSEESQVCCWGPSSVFSSWPALYLFFPSSSPPPPPPPRHLPTPIHQELTSQSFIFASSS